MKQAAKEEFLKLLEPVYPRLSRYALAITHNAEEAKDLTSDAVLITLEQFGKMKDKEHFAGFLFKVASRLQKRRRYRDRFQLPFDASSAESRYDTDPQPDQAAEIAIIMDTLEKLPPKVKETVILFDVADLSLEDIRSIQGGSLSGVKSRLKRGRETVQQYLGIKDKHVEMNLTAIKHETFITVRRKKGESYAL